MIFVIDVGNTNMTMGVFQGKKLEATFRIMTKTPRTSDEYGIMITQLLKNNGIEVTDIEGVIIASVVPIDGSNDLITFVRIILPLSTPVLASVALFYAVGHWNSYFNAMMYISDPDMELMTIVLRRMVFLTNKITQDSTFDWGAAGMPPAKSIKMATTVVATVPMLCIYPFVQKYFTQGIMVGSVKG